MGKEAALLQRCPVLLPAHFVLDTGENRGHSVLSNSGNCFQGELFPHLPFSLSSFLLLVSKTFPPPLTFQDVTHLCLHYLA